MQSKKLIEEANKKKKEIDNSSASEDEKIAKKKVIDDTVISTLKQLEGATTKEAIQKILNAALDFIHSLRLNFSNTGYTEVSSRKFAVPNTSQTSEISYYLAFIFASFLALIGIKKKKKEDKDYTN